MSVRFFFAAIAIVALVLINLGGQNPQAHSITECISPLGRPTAWGLTVQSPFIPTNQPGTCAMFIPFSQIGKSNAACKQMVKTKTAVRSAPTAVPVVKRTVFAFKTRPAIAPKGPQKGAFTAVVNETGGEGDDEFNRVHTGVRLEATDGKGNCFQVGKDYNILGSGRGLKAFLDDYNSAP